MNKGKQGSRPRARKRAYRYEKCCDSKKARESFDRAKTRAIVARLVHIIDLTKGNKVVRVCNHVDLIGRMRCGVKPEFR